MLESTIETPGTVLITGAGGGIGRAIGLRFASAGHDVILVDHDPDATAASLDAIASTSARCVAQVADVCDADALTEAVRDGESKLGPVAVLVNGAGIEGASAPVWSYPPEVFDRVMAVNLRGVFNGLAAVMPGMIARGQGAVVNVASTSGIRGRKGLSGYVASKHAVVGLTRAAALDAAGSGVTVNAVLPGPVRGAMIERIDAMSGGIERAGPAVLAEPEDVAESVAFLASPAARHLNGTTLVVDAGSTVA